MTTTTTTTSLREIVDLIDDLDAVEQRQLHDALVRRMANPPGFRRIDQAYVTEHGADGAITRLSATPPR